MGKTTGFLEFTRELPKKRSVEERVKDYKEFESLYSDKTLNEQAARCMNCGVPFCHSGCPLGNVIPEFNDAVYRKDWKEAYEVLSSTNNFPEFTGRICPAPCESACVLGINQPPIAIEEIEKHIIEKAFDLGLVKPRTAIVRTGKKVAVIGSGPAGLAAAAQLNEAGHSVTVFERDDAAGGLLRYGIPDFKLEKNVIDRRIALMEQEGIVFKYNANVGVNVKMNDILREFNAVVLCGGANEPIDLPLRGRELKGVHFAMPYLKQQNKRNASKDPLALPKIESNVAEEEIIATNKNVIIIGGGDTGSDCVGTANRQNAKSIRLFARAPLPPEDRDEYNPWPLYPMVLRTSSSHEEGVERHWAIGTKEFLGDENGNLRAIKVVDLEWKIEKGKRIQYYEVPNTERELPCELALLAIGFAHPEHNGLVEDLGVELDTKGNVRATEQSYRTNITKIFACGDMRRGQSLVVWAISEGRECARRVDEFLTGSSLLESKDENLVIANG